MHIAARISLLVLLSLAACATDRYRNLSHSGGKLAVEAVTYDEPIVERSELRDSTGSLVGTQETVVGTKPVVVGYSLQLDKDIIDERDFYQLAGDRNTADAIASARASGKLRNRTGLLMAAASVAAAIAVPVTFGRSTAPYAVGQAFVFTPVGLYLAITGKRRVEEYHYDAAHAFQSLGQQAPEWARR